MVSSDLLFLLLLYISTVTAAADTPPPPSAGGCSNQVVAFSPCLQYISLSPNNRTATPSSSCCVEYHAAFGNGSATCLCHLVQQPLLLGFPLSTARILSLSSLCSLSNAANSSLESYCSGSSSLPPLQAITGPRVPTRPRPRFRAQHPGHGFPPPRPISPSDVSDNDAPSTEDNMPIATPTSSSLQPNNISSVAGKISTRLNMSFGLIISILVPLSTLRIDTPLYHLFVDLSRAPIFKGQTKR